MPIFLDDCDYRQFIRLLGEVVAAFGAECWNYCVMPNHYHLTVRPTQPNLSETIQHLNSSYAQWWNKRHKRVGHVFQGRFKDQVVDTETYLLTLSRYVAMNPVRGALVERPESWPWSSYAATIGSCPAPAFLSAEFTLRLVGGESSAFRQARFVRFVTGEENSAADDWIRSKTRVLGDRVFKDRVATIQRTGSETILEPCRT